MTTPGGVDANAVYSLGHSDGESSRLQRQADELLPQSAALVDRTTLGPGAAAIDVGCGPRGVLELLASRVGPLGKVVGVDADPNHVEMARLAKPGGWVIGLEPDVEPSVCYPPSPSYDRLGSMFPVVFSRNGADWRMGRRVAELYRAAGLVDVHVETRAEVYPKGHTRRTIRVDLLRSMRPFIVELGLATDAELDQLFADALAHLDDPDVVLMPSVNFLVSGRKPDST